MDRAWQTVRLTGAPPPPGLRSYDLALLGTSGGTGATAPCAWLPVPRAALRIVSFSDILVTVTTTAR